MSTQQTGISFPFRIGVKGGVVLSTTTNNSVPHIEESIEQIIRTHLYERVMETHCYSSVETFVFSEIGESEKSLMRYAIVDALTLQDLRIEVKPENVTFEQSDKRGFLFVHINYKVKALDSSFNTTIEIRGDTLI